MHGFGCKLGHDWQERCCRRGHVNPDEFWSMAFAAALMEALGVLSIHVCILLV